MFGAGSVLPVLIVSRERKANICCNVHRRRICPGMIVAEREIWLTISRMLWAFDMQEIPGQPINLKEYDGLSGRSPVPFHITLKPRHGNVDKVLGGIDC
jgi:hypothetical protein